VCHIMCIRFTKKFHFTNWVHVPLVMLHKFKMYNEGRGCFICCRKTTWGKGNSVKICVIVYFIYIGAWGHVLPFRGIIWFRLLLASVLLFWEMTCSLHSVSTPVSSSTLCILLYNWHYYIWHFCLTYACRVCRGNPACMCFWYLIEWCGRYFLTGWPR